MKKIILVALSLMVTSLTFGQKKKIFYDTLGKETEFETYWSQVVGGRYKSVSKNKVYTLVRATDKEFKEELLKTEKRIVRKVKLRTDFPEFQATDLNGNSVSKNDLVGKIVVVNVWFIGCSPCEMERPELNGLASLYTDNKDVVFISFARNSAQELPPFLKYHPLSYSIIPVEKSEIIRLFGSDVYPTNVIIGRDGKYLFDSGGTGVGISYILKREIDQALNSSKSLKPLASAARYFSFILSDDLLVRSQSRCHFFFGE